LAELETKNPAASIDSGKKGELEATLAQELAV
jgi:hypothetical protein